MSQDISVFDKPSVNEISQYTMKSGYTSKSWLNNNNINNNTNILLGDKNVSNNNYSQVILFFIISVTKHQLYPYRQPKQHNKLCANRWVHSNKFLKVESIIYGK